MILPQHRSLQTSTPATSLLEGKTGQTGAAVLGTGLAAYLVSKEVIIFHAETVVVAAIGAVTYGVMKNVRYLGTARGERRESVE